MTGRFKNIFHTLLIFILITFLLHSKILSNFVWTFPELFMDFKTPIDWLECHSLGFNLITLENVDCIAGKNIGQFNYGYAFLSIPYNETLGIFYRTYLPWILIFLDIPEDLSCPTFLIISIKGKGPFFSKNCIVDILF